MPLGIQNLFIFTQGAEQESLAKAFPAAIAAAVCDTLMILVAVWGVAAAVREIAWLTGEATEFVAILCPNHI